MDDESEALDFFDPFVGMADCSVRGGSTDSLTFDARRVSYCSLSSVEADVDTHNDHCDVFIEDDKRCTSPSPLECRNGHESTWKPMTFTHESKCMKKDKISAKVRRNFVKALHECVRTCLRTPGQCYCGVELCSKSGAFLITDYQQLSEAFVNYLRSHKTVSFEYERDANFAKQVLKNSVKSGLLHRTWKIVHRAPHRVFSFSDDETGDEAYSSESDSSISDFDIAVDIGEVRGKVPLSNAWSTRKVLKKLYITRHKSVRIK